MAKVVEGSFLAIVAKDAKPYENYPHVEKRVADAAMDVFLMINRWDGKIGFPGGTMEDGENAVQTAVREAKEEIGLELSKEEISLLWYIGTRTYQDERIDLTTHLYAHFVSYEKLKEIARGVYDAEHFGSEATGFVMVQCFDNAKGGISQFLKNNFPHTAEEQVRMLVAQLELIQGDEVV